MYLVELREAVRILIDVALEYLKKRVRNLKTKQAKRSEQDTQDKDTETEHEHWTDDEVMKIFMSIVKVLQINFPLYKVHKIYAAVSDATTGASIPITYTYCSQTSASLFSSYIFSKSVHAHKSLNLFTFEIEQIVA